MDILFRHARVLTMESDRILEDAMVVVSGKRLSYVGAEDPERLKQRYDRVIDASNMLLMPGFVNLHTHLAMTLLRGYGSDLPLQAWLEEKMWPMEDRFTEEDYIAGSQMAIAEMLRSGTTCFLDMYMGMDHVARVTEQSGIRGVLSRGLVAFDLEQMKPKLEENIRLFENWNNQGDGRIRVFLGPHGEYTNTPETLRAYAACAEKLGCGIHVHVAETRGERQGCIERHGCSPVRFLEEMGLFEGRTVAAHCVWVDEDDMEILARHRVAVAHNPASNMKLGSGLAPITRMREKGICVGIGTDGAASNNRLDMMAEANLASLGAKGFTADPTALPAFETLKMATIEGARALGLDDQIGTLTAGKRADLIALEVTAPAYQPRGELLNHLVYSANSRDVVLTMVDGRILMEDGRVLTMDEEKLAEAFARRADRLYG